MATRNNAKTSPFSKAAEKLGEALKPGHFNFGRMAEEIMSLAMSAREEGSSRVKGEIEKLLQRMDIVTRREFDAVREIAIAARTQAEELAAQINGGKKKPAPKAAAKKAPVKKPVAKTVAKKPVAKKPAAKKR